MRRLGAPKPLDSWLRREAAMIGELAAASLGHCDNPAIIASIQRRNSSDNQQS